MTFRPHITLFYFLSVFLILFTFALFIPENGIKINEKLRISFVQPKDIFTLEKAEYADITQIIDNSKIIFDTAGIEENLKEPEIEEVGFDTIRADAESLKQSVHKIEFPKSYKKMLYPVFKAMDNARANNKVVRVMHFGDSQIEGDRMTSFIRYRLQKKFGGSGIGLVPVQQVYDYRFSIIQENSDNWYRYVLYGRPDTTITHSRYGLIGSFCRFTPYPKVDSIKDTTTYSAWVSFSESPYSYSNTKTYEQCRVFYGYNETPFITELSVNEELMDADMYPPSNSLQKIEWLFQEPVSDIKLTFKGSSSPEIYCIALDGKSGVAVDNIAMRGSSGLIFTKMDNQLFSNLLKELNVKLMFLQFGGNVIPNIKEDYSYYERWLSAQLSRIKKVAPNTQVIVIGVADMSIKEKNRYVSYPNVEKVRDAMKKAAFKNGCAYWDMFEAMGGRNSMPSWVFAQPPLATKDFVHFNARGAKLISNMFYNALIFEYQLYKKENLTEAKKNENGQVAEN